MYVQRSYRIQLVTPAFLGNAEQNAQWRTPPIKHLLREWWRVAYAADRKFNVDVAKMRREEGLLFGNAWLAGEFCKSRIRLRLEGEAAEPAKAWALGTQRGIVPMKPTPETSYAWFGLVKRRALKPGATEGCRRLHLAFPNEPSLDQRMHEVVRLITTLGLLGSRSRGGWGALHVEGVEPLTKEELEKYARPLEQCLETDWAMSLAMDSNDNLCVWISKNQSVTAWHEVMQEIAKLRREVRQKLKNVQKKDLRSALGFAGTGRMPSPLRWKVFPIQSNRLAFRVFAMPHCLPAEGGRSMPSKDLCKAWQQVFETLDKSSVVERI